MNASAAARSSLRKCSGMYTLPSLPHAFKGGHHRGHRGSQGNGLFFYSASLLRTYNNFSTSAITVPCSSFTSTLKVGSYLGKVFSFSCDSQFSVPSSQQTPCRLTPGTRNSRKIRVS